MIDHYLDIFSNYVLQHPYIGELATFLIAFGESLPLIGTIIPGSITMTVIGILVGRNILPMSTTLILATLGALTGDMIGFWVGKHYNERLRYMWPFKKHPKWLTMGEGFFKKHGGKSILLGRFVGPARSSVPLFAGLLKMRWSKFLMAAIPSAVLWALLYIVPGIILGAISLAIPKEKATTFTLIGLGIIVTLWLIFWAIQRSFVYIALKINSVIDRSWDWLNRHHASKFIIRLITNQKEPNDHHQLTLIFLATLSLVLFIITFISIIAHVGIYRLNQPIFYLVETLRNHGLSKFFVVMTGFGDKYMLIVACSLVVLFFALKRQWYVFWHVVAITIISLASVWIFKHVYYSPRPSGFMIVAKNSSFPSGHSTLSVSLLGFAAFLIAQCIKKKWHWIPYTVASILVLGIVFSRLYLGAHWLSDVLGGVFLGFTILLLAITSYRRDHPVNLKQSSASVILAAILVPWGIFTGATFHHNMYRYTPYFPNRVISEQQWWQNSNDELPIYRLNRLGHRIQPFNIQMVGSLSSFKALLLSKGWKGEINKKTMKTALGRFASKLPEQHIAFLHQLYQQKPPVLFLIKSIPNKKSIIELRLWQTGIRMDSDIPLFLGSINYHKPATSLLNLHPHLQITLENGGGIKELIQAIRESYQWKQIVIDKHALPKRILYLHWDGKIILIRPKSHTVIPAKAGTS